MGFVRGDRVRLTKKAAEQHMRGFSRLPRKHVPGKFIVDWASRVGTVANTARNESACVTIKWDGVKGNQSFPKAMVELIIS